MTYIHTTYAFREFHARVYRAPYICYYTDLRKPTLVNFTVRIVSRIPECKHRSPGIRMLPGMIYSHSLDVGNLQSAFSQIKNYVDTHSPRNTCEFLRTLFCYGCRYVSSNLCICNFQRVRCAQCECDREAKAH